MNSNFVKIRSTSIILSLNGFVYLSVDEYNDETIKEL